MSRVVIKWMGAFLLLAISANLYAQNTINSVRVWPSPDSTRVVFDLTDKPDFSYFMLKNPLRLVVDLENTDKIKDLPTIPSKHQIVSKLRYSKAKSSQGVRFVFELTGAVKPVIFALAPTGPYKNRLVVDLYDKNQAEPVAATSNTAVKKRELNQQRDIIIAIDAGHGGEDPGSIGPSGTYEKDITLQIAKRLERMIDAERGMISRMVRSGDYFVKLNTRTSRARQKKADFLVSIHADAFTSPQPNGASVWVLSLRRANSEIGKWIEDKEKHSELLGGAAGVIKDTASEKYLAQALLDMSMDHSMKTGFSVAEGMVQELKKVAKLHKKEPQAASLAVLKSPDIPSILVETGFISNPREEKLLKSANHQERLAKAIFTSIKSYYLKNPPDDSLFASLKSQYPTKHKVRPGESLSLLASRYGVSVGKLKQVNQLKSNTLFIGQELDIPQS
ncbi:MULTISPECIES: N-acetylmuramoyl-L-alanine amidase [Pseudoalteromonas]|uniref:N-acetylmuramoyl-L-alanine amidase n=1 Tax=Pseudoalteromonas TaxID=53246 RepID=UPI0012309A79|nr:MULTISPECIES: N-acetylmuramoyl-L-alanine amidase [Pseudoalteromonas]MBB1335102.1 N-acetylmuramoyl-L-alanine amidase [Pseudoalteromonas sp. SR41-6]MBB1343504.1 N-acetylmuramoyl-L-alanine amidase [Pseudoalteromonas sp. SR45-6]MBB1460524.1 N-acetylmuramoyl-L-alanine amidase [Pseudoalteromonas sp. SG41-8]